MRKRLFTSALLLLTTFAFHLLSSTPAYARLAAPQTQAATPETVVDEPLFDWTIGGSLLYWGDRCPPGPDIVSAGVDSTSATYLLRRMPLNGGTARTLDTSMDVDCANFQYMVADGKAIYYYNQSDRLIEKVPVGAPNAGPKTVADVGVGGFGPTTDLKIKDGMLYYGIKDRL